MFGLSCKHCGSEDLVTNTVKVDLEDLAVQRRAKEDEVRREEEQRREQARLTKVAELRAQEARWEQAQAQAQKEIKDAQDAEAQRVSEDSARQAREEEEARRAKEQVEQRAKEEERKQREGVAAEEERLRKERERQVQELIEEDGRKKQVAAFLEKNGFKAIDVKKSSLMSSTYALHKAAEAGDEKMVAMLIKEGANTAQKNSTGKTAAEVAQKKNKAGSHAKVIVQLRGARSTTGVRGGA